LWGSACCVTPRIREKHQERPDTKKRKQQKKKKERSQINTVVKKVLVEIRFYRFLWWLCGSMGKIF